MTQNNSLVMILEVDSDILLDEPCSRLVVKFGYFNDNDIQQIRYFSSIFGTDDRKSFVDLTLEKYSINDSFFMVPLFDEVGHCSVDVGYHFSSLMTADLDLVSAMKKRLAGINKAIDNFQKKSGFINGIGDIDSNINYISQFLCEIGKHLKVTHTYFYVDKKARHVWVDEFGKKSFEIIRNWFANSLDLHYHINNQWERVWRYTKAPSEWELDLSEVVTVQFPGDSVIIPQYRGVLIPRYFLAKQEEIYRKNGYELLSEMALRLTLNKLKEPHLFSINPDRVYSAEKAFKQFVDNLVDWQFVNAGGWKSYGAYELCQFANFTPVGCSTKHTVKVSAYFPALSDPNAETNVKIVTEKHIK